MKCKTLEEFWLTYNVNGLIKIKVNHELVDYTHHEFLKLNNTSFTRLFTKILVNNGKLKYITKDKK